MSAVSEVPVPSPPGVEPTTPARKLDAQTLVSVIVPCHNEQAVLPLLFRRVQAAAATWGTRYEVILVDDGSSDGTWEEMLSCHRQDPRWKLVRLGRNFGHQLALWAGLQHVSGDVTAILDADLQDPPEALLRFLRAWEEGYDVVYAVRQKRKEGPLKRLAYHVYYRILAFLSEIEIPLDAGDFGVTDRRVLQAMASSREPGPFIRGLRVWVGFRQIGLPYERDRRAAGEPKYTFRKLLELGLNGIIGFSIRPLRLATYLGLVVSFTAFLGALFTLFQRLFAEQFARVGLAPVPGFATIVIAILFLGGVQLLCLGILGEYIGRIYQNVTGRPAYTVSERCGLGTVPAPAERNA